MKCITSIICLREAIQGIFYMHVLTEFFIVVLRGTLITTFAVAAISKIQNMKVFAEAVGSFRILPPRLQAGFAYAFVTVELSTVLLLTLNIVIFGSILALCTLCVFTTALSINLIRRRYISCNCFGPEESVISMYDVARNVSLICCAVAALYFASIQQTSSVTLNGLELLLGVLIGLVTAIALINLKAFAFPLMERK